MTPSRRLATIVLCSLFAAPLLARAADSVAPSGGETRTVPEFQAIAVSGGIDLVVRQGTPQRVQVQADDKLLPLLETAVESGEHGATLHVRWKKDKGMTYRGSSKVQVEVVVPRLVSLAGAGAGDIRLETFATPALQATIAGAGDLHLNGLTADELGVRIAGSGDIGGSGKATRLKVSIAGSGDVHLREMRADEVTVKIAGSGGAAVNAEKTLQVSIAGSGDVTYTGNATVKSSVAGSGSVTRR